MKLIIAILLGKLVYFLTRFFKIGGGSAAPGLYALKIEPDLVKKLSSQIPQNIIITGTNGKTTTARILDHLVKQQKIKTLRNSTGSNLERGITSALLQKANLYGRIKDIDLGLWELDEAAFNKVLFQIKPQIMVFLNAFRDQLDRYGEVDTVVKNWQQALGKVDWKSAVLINGNDLNTSKLADIKKLHGQLFRVQDLGFIGERIAEEGRAVKEADFEAKIIKNRGMEGAEISVNYPGGKKEFSLKLAGTYHVFDFLAAFSAYINLNLPHTNLSMADFSPAFGRVEKFSWGYIFLIKNPVGASLVFKTIQPELKINDTLFIALNDNFADGTDVSWIWDAEFELLCHPERSEGYNIICSGTRADDLALRLKYAGVEQKRIIVEPGLDKAFKLAKQTLIGRLFILPTYTALLELQKILTKQKIKPHYWQEEA